MLDFDKDIEIISEHESGVDTVSTSGYVRYKVMRVEANLTGSLSVKPFTCFSRTESRSLGSDDTTSSPRTPDGLTWPDLINRIYFVNI